MSEMIQPVVQRAKSGFDFREVDEDTRCRVDFAAGVDFDTERAAMQARALVASGSRGRRWAELRNRTRGTLPSGDPEVLMDLQAEPPLRVRQAVLDRQRRVLVPLRAVHGLEQEPVEAEVLERLGRGARLGVNQL